jgi:hypothetical protein
MNQLKEQKFLEAISPVLNKLADEWFEPSLKSPEGQFYACTYCDMECGGTERHDKDCLSDLAKKVLEKMQGIDESVAFTSSIKGEPRLPEAIFELRSSAKMRVILKEFISVKLMSFIPLDYTDKDNKNVGCFCNFFESRKNQGSHQKDCVIVNISQALADLYQTKN